MVNGNNILNAGNHVFHGDVDACIIIYILKFLLLFILLNNNIQLADIGILITDLKKKKSYLLYHFNCLYYNMYRVILLSYNTSRYFKKH